MEELRKNICICLQSALAIYYITLFYLHMYIYTGYSVIKTSYKISISTVTLLKASLFNKTFDISQYMHLYVLFALYKMFCFLKLKQSQFKLEFANKPKINKSLPLILVIYEGTYVCTCVAK